MKIANLFKSIKSKKIEFKAFTSGKLISLRDVNDEVFSSGMMGDGIAIIPSKGELYSPTSGTIKMVFPTKHAIGIITNEGVEFILHIGIDTVQLQGKHFTSFVEVGDKIRKGDLIVKFDLKELNDNGYDTVIPLVITNTNGYDIIDKISIIDVTSSNTVMSISES